MDFYFPDSQDQVDPCFDFVNDEHRPFHVRQRDDRYAHEIHDEPPYDGILISKTMVDGYGTGGRYTAAQRHRLYRLGVREFFRLPAGMKVIGDCGAFSYVAEEEPPVTVSEVIDFYETLGVDEGISVDHAILGYNEACDRNDEPTPEDWIDRQAITLERAADFFAEHRERNCSFTPMGAAQGWSPCSYADSVQHLQELGYRRIALGGMVPLKSIEIIACLAKIDEIRDPEVSLHLLGISRPEHYATFHKHGVRSLDSTSPFRQAFKDDKDNYYTSSRNFVALRIPPSDSNARLQGRIRAGKLDQATVRAAEDEALRAVRAYDAGTGSLLEAVDALRAYEILHDTKGRDRSATYRDFLEVKPWAKCPCAICREWGVEVAMFRGTERNKRRGMHNLWVFNQKLQGQKPARRHPKPKRRQRESA
ncbi:MAG: queuine/other tRNA-ribosyltransferase [Actinobacteria bacterium]|nr:queuine/other tRNA-ribosyltransferase [Actinomycetota bacterium]